MVAAARFQTTSWSLVFAAGGSPDALNDLCARYWLPVFAYVRRYGFDRADAEDLTQAFFGSLLERGDFRRADPRRGKFRSFLLGSLKHFLSNERDRAQAKKRGGDVVHVEVDVDTADGLTPDQLFDKQWALAVLERVVGELRAAGEPEHLLPFLTGEQSYAAVAEERKTSEGALRVAVHRLRRRFRDRLRRAVAETVEPSDDVDDEIRFLIAAVSARP